MLILKKSLFYTAILLPVFLIGFILGASYIEYDISSRRVEAQEISLDTGYEFGWYNSLFSKAAIITYAIDNRDSMLKTVHDGENSPNDFRNMFYTNGISNTLYAYAYLEDTVAEPRGRVRDHAQNTKVKLSKAYRSRESWFVIQYADFRIFQPRVQALIKKVGVSSVRAKELASLFRDHQDISLKEPPLSATALKEINAILRQWC